MTLIVRTSSSSVEDLKTFKKERDERMFQLIKRYLENPYNLPKSIQEANKYYIIRQFIALNLKKTPHIVEPLLLEDVKELKPEKPLQKKEAILPIIGKIALIACLLFFTQIYRKLFN